MTPESDEKEREQRCRPAAPVCCERERERERERRCMRDLRVRSERDFGVSRVFFFFPFFSAFTPKAAPIFFLKQRFSRIPAIIFLILIYYIYLNKYMQYGTVYSIFQNI